MAATPLHDYALTEANSRAAIAAGLANAQWYRTLIPRETMKELIQRHDGPALRDTAIWLAALVASGTGGALLWGTWWAAPFFAVYGVLYGSSTDSRWHECGHGTAFRTQWMNQVVYQVACFMILREPTVWRWSHARHHTDTIIVGRDPEIAAMRPPDVAGMVLNLFALKSGAMALRTMLVHATGRLSEAERGFIPPGEHWKVFAVARIWTAIYAATIGLSLATWSLLPLMLVGLPSFYGAPLVVIFGLTQHAGLDENVLDHRLNTRTVYMNPVFRFLYWNMNYHIEHHMFPTVPYHALPRLHELMKADTPAPSPSLLAAYREIIPALRRQLRNPAWHLHRKLPASARPYLSTPATQAAAAPAAAAS